MSEHLDPDATLNDIRAAVSDYSAAPRGSALELEAAKRVLELTDDLDTHLQLGGVLPRKWRLSIVPTLQQMADAGEIITVTTSDPGLDRP